MQLEGILQSNLELQHPLLGLRLSFLPSSWPQRIKGFSDTESKVAFDSGHTSWRAAKEVRMWEHLPVLRSVPAAASLVAAGQDLALS